MKKSRFVRLWRQDSGRFQAANEGFGFANGDFHPDQPVHVGLDPSQLRGQEGDGAAVQVTRRIIPVRMAGSRSFQPVWPREGRWQVRVKCREMPGFFYPSERARRSSAGRLSTYSLIPRRVFPRKMRSRAWMSGGS